MNSMLNEYAKIIAKLRVEVEQAKKWSSLLEAELKVCGWTQQQIDKYRDEQMRVRELRNQQR